MNTRFLVYTALMTAIIAVLGVIPAIPLPFIPVPIVIQNVGIFLAGILLGRKYGFLSVIVFLLLVLIGAPLLSGGRGGYGVFFGPTAGFLIMYPIVAFLIGWMRDRQFERLNLKRIFIIILIFGVILLDVVGAIVMGLIINMPIHKALWLSMTFLPGDIIKAVIASLIAVALLKNPVTARIMRGFTE
ncbi:biotin transporter BioY [Staphylococcus felis]|uniref:Biotin transporter n=1 Tax=Staphylococcus felis TaxID=46127 RepID=A0A2K3ZGF7_9STAP|nr:biotin transporter BioY [Staphylococcus felis]AVP36465.1 biotin transporter BioY [Staphylococcus felis]MBH9581684.1 biotin transporter BioY [Staphylococcus felis]MDM8327630.1 biotin transporter BioY [Staphylococcus felis]MDQ7192101.1 biotin transporter BioY [Staphylococcus felis]PNZ36949.1 biotin transporter BioY [Staphylococcus felis]